MLNIKFNYRRGFFWSDVRGKVFEGIIVAGLVAATIILFSPLLLIVVWLFMVLWGAVMPDIFPGITTLSFWQSLQLLLLLSIAVKNNRGSKSKD